MALDHVTLRVSGMTCDSCATTCQMGLMKVSGVIGASVNWRTGRAEVVFDVELGRADILEAPIFTREVRQRFARHRYHASLAGEEEKQWPACC